MSNLDQISAAIGALQAHNDEKVGAVDGLLANRALKGLALVCAAQFGMTPAEMKAAVRAKL